VTEDSPVNSEGGGTLIGGPNRLLMAMGEACVSQLLGSTQGYGWSSWIKIKTGSMAGPGLCTLRRQTSALKM